VRKMSALRHKEKNKGNLEFKELNNLEDNKLTLEVGAIN
jgi:hypothetical protein